MAERRYSHGTIANGIESLPFRVQRMQAADGVACIWCGWSRGHMRPVGWFQDVQVVEHSDRRACELMRRASRASCGQAGGERISGEPLAMHANLDHRLDLLRERIDAIPDLERERHRRARMEVVVAQIADFAYRARDHVDVTQDLVVESAGWPRDADREWARSALEEAIATVTSAERDLARASAILAELCGVDDGDDLGG